MSEALRKEQTRFTELEVDWPNGSSTETFHDLIWTPQSGLPLASITIPFRTYILATLVLIASILVGHSLNTAKVIMTTESSDIERTPTRSIRSVITSMKHGRNQIVTSKIAICMLVLL